MREGDRPAFALLRGKLQTHEEQLADRVVLEPLRVAKQLARCGMAETGRAVGSIGVSTQIAALGDREIEEPASAGGQVFAHPAEERFELGATVEVKHRVEGGDDQFETPSQVHPAHVTVHPAHAPADLLRLSLELGLQIA